MVAFRTLELFKSTSNEGGMSEHIEVFTHLFTLVQQLNPATFAEFYVQSCHLLRNTDFKQ